MQQSRQCELEIFVATQSSIAASNTLSSAEDMADQPLTVAVAIGMQMATVTVKLVTDTFKDTRVSADKHDPACHNLSVAPFGRVGLSLTRQCLPECRYNLPVIITGYAEVMPGERLSLGTLC